MNISDEIQLADFRIMLADHGEPIEWDQADLDDSHELTAIVDRGPKHRSPHERGPEPLVDLLVNVLITDLPEGYNPDAALINYDSETYRPQNTHRDTHVLTIECRQL